MNSAMKELKQARKLGAKPFRGEFVNLYKTNKNRHWVCEVNLGLYAGFACTRVSNSHYWLVKHMMCACLEAHACIGDSK